MFVDRNRSAIPHISPLVLIPILKLYSPIILRRVLKGLRDSPVAKETEVQVALMVYPALLDHQVTQALSEGKETKGQLDLRVSVDHEVVREMWEQ